MEKIKLKRGQKVFCCAPAYVKYAYSIEDISNKKPYEIIRGFGDKCLQTGVYLDFNEFNIVDDKGEPAWFTLTNLENETIFRLVESK